MAYDAPDAPSGQIRIDGERLDFARRAAQLSQRELADRVGVSPGHMSRILNGHSGVSPEVMDAILAVFGNRITFGELRAMQQAPSGEPDGAC